MKKYTRNLLQELSVLRKNKYLSRTDVDEKKSSNNYRKI